MTSGVNRGVAVVVGMGSELTHPGMKRGVAVVVGDVTHPGMKMGVV